MNQNKEDNILLQWQVFPFGKERKRGVFGLAVIALFCWAVYYNFGEVFWAGLALIILAMVVMPFYAPTLIVFTEKGILSKNFINRKYKTWDSIARWEKGEKGVLVSPFEKSSFLDSYRGIYLMFNDNADDVMKIVKEKLGESEL